jgi:hypothetical protein
VTASTQPRSAPRPPEPPVGAVLETSYEGDTYRIERTPEGWAIQYRDGESEHGHRLTGSRISWRAAWSAWGPPAGAEPFRPVPADAPPLPPYPPEPAPAWVGMGMDASGQQIAMPPPAQPYRPPASTTGGTMSDSIGGAAQGIRGSNDIAGEATGILAQAITKLEEARNRLQAAVAGSPQADVGEAVGLHGRAIDAIQDAQKAVQAAQSAGESVAGRL